ncbi:MAG: [Fe-Fe] hydrogenase large subunit C-terminal domain-containing protein [Limnochordia bacterium]|jgi:iron only hydrogenase large subunit-like protein
MKNIFAYRILVHVARGILEKDSSLNRLVEKISRECLPQEVTPGWEDLVRKRVELLLSPRDGTPFIQYLDHECSRCPDDSRACLEACPVEAIEILQGRPHIDDERCIQCGRCVDGCISGMIVEHSDLARVAHMLLEEEPVYAILAPSFVGQFGSASPGQIRGALEKLGFAHVYEVAMAADIITTLEAQEFYRRYHAGKPFMITSCCCPAFIKLIEKHRPKLTHIVSDAVSPMVALGRLLHHREPSCRVVFIGPCVAKKAEAKRAELADAVDAVLTFKETQALLEAAQMEDLTAMPSRPLEDAARGGRNFAYSGGVTEAIKTALADLDASIELIGVYGNGLQECSQLLKEIEAGELEANFMEGMACRGGCVGGPGTIIDAERGKAHVQAFAGESPLISATANHRALQWVQHFPREKLLSTKVKLRVPIS